MWEQEERRLRLFLDMVVVFRADFPSLPRHNPAWYPSFYAPNYLPTGSLEMMAQAVVLALEQVTGLEVAQRAAWSLWHMMSWATTNGWNTLSDFLRDTTYHSNRPAARRSSLVRFQHTAILSARHLTVPISLCLLFCLQSDGTFLTLQDESRVARTSAE